MKPIVGEYLNNLMNAGFIKSFMYFEDKEGLFLLFKEEGDYDELLFSQRNNKNFEEERIIGEHSLWMYKIPIELIEDFEKIKRGEYSKLSDWWKKQYDKTVKINFKEYPSLQHQVFSKSPDFRKGMEAYIGMEIDPEQEIFSIPNKDKETLKIEEYELTTVS